jgi:hypothetical protein
MKPHLTAPYGFGGGVKKILSQLPELALRIYKLTKERGRTQLTLLRDS